MDSWDSNTGYHNLHCVLLLLPFLSSRKQRRKRHRFETRAHWFLSLIRNYLNLSHIENKNILLYFPILRSTCNGSWYCNNKMIINYQTIFTNIFLTSTGLWLRIIKYVYLWSRARVHRVHGLIIETSNESRIQICNASTSYARLNL